MNANEKGRQGEKDIHLGMASPTTPATTGPVCIPILSWSVSEGRCEILKKSGLP